MTHRALADLGGGTIGGLLAARAAANPGKTALVTAAETLSYGELDERATRVARGLIGLGAGRGDAVAVFLRNRAEWVTTWLGIARAAMVTVPVNTAYKDDFLHHALSLTRSRVVVTERALVPLIAEIVSRLPDLGHIVVVDEHGLAVDGVETLHYDTLLERGTADIPLPAVSPSDIAQVSLTSGTTGRSKGVVIPHLMALVAARENAVNLGTTNRDVLYTCLPLFHGAAQLNLTMQGFYNGSTVVVGERFSASRFWDEIRAHGVTVFNALGSVLVMLLARPPSDRDRDHAVRRVFAAPAPPEVLLPAEERFGVHIVEGYGMTEIKNVTYNPVEGRKVGSVGRPTASTVLQIQGEDGTALGAGEIGEICYRPRSPHIMFTEYLQDPAATVKATRGLWFHTGDLGYVDHDGFYYFVDRHQDALRRRGENISSAAVEAVLAAFPGVTEAAAVATPSDVGEDEILAIVESGAPVDLEALFRHCDARLPYFMVPRFYRAVPGLPRTPTGKVRKAALREETAGVWDAQAHGLKPSRQA